MSSTLTSVVGTSEWLSRPPEQDGFAEYVPRLDASMKGDPRRDRDPGRPRGTVTRENATTVRSLAQATLAFVTFTPTLGARLGLTWHNSGEASRQISAHRSHRCLPPCATQLTG